MKSYSQIIDDYVEGFDFLLFDLIMYYMATTVITLGYLGAFYYSVLFLTNGGVIPLGFIGVGIATFFVISIYNVYNIYEGYTTIKKDFTKFRRNDFNNRKQ